MNDNAKQIEYWNGPTGERWAGRQDVVDRNLGSINDALMAFAGPRTGMRVLDIGCGGGTTSLRLAQAVAPGKVTGVDISAPMLTVARTRSPDLEFVQADASAHSFKPEFDMAFSRFGVMFFADPVAAFANIKTALKRGGRLAFACWRAFEENPWAHSSFVAARDLLPALPPQEPHAPGPYALADGERLQTILAQSGYQGIRIERLDSVMNMGANADEAANEAMYMGPLAHASRNLDEGLRQKIRSRARDTLATFATPQGVSPPASCWLVSARA